VRGRMERWFGADFSRVRVHIDTDAQRSAEAMQAAAYTIGHDIVFGAGKYTPESAAGRRLLAHELTHVVQQQAAEPVSVPEIVSPFDSSETEACRAAPATRLSRQAIQLTPVTGDPATRPELSPEGVAKEIEGLLDKVFLDFDDQARIIELLMDVENARRPGVVAGEARGQVFSHLRADLPGRLKMALHAPIAAITHADPTYYDLLFDRIDDLMPVLIMLRDQTIHRGRAPATRKAAPRKAQGEKQEKEPEKEAAHPETGTPAPVPHPPSAAGSSTVTLDSRLQSFISDLHDDPVHRSQVQVTSTIRSPEQDARAVLNNQRRNKEYYRIFSANWREAICKAIKDRDLADAADFDSAVHDLTQSIESTLYSPHNRGRAVDFALRDASFQAWLKSKCDERGFQFLPEIEQHHYHVQLSRTQ